MPYIIQIFKYFVRIFPNIGLYISEEILKLNIKDVLFSFLTWKDIFSTKSNNYDNLILVW